MHPTLQRTKNEFGTARLATEIDNNEKYTATVAHDRLDVFWLA